MAGKPEKPVEKKPSDPARAPKPKKLYELETVRRKVTEKTEVIFTDWASI